MTRESDIERPASAYAALRRWFTFKLMRANINGLPDRWHFRRVRRCPHCGNQTQVLLIEYKATGEAARPDQLERIEELRAAGVTVYVVDDLDEAKRLLR